MRSNLSDRLATAIGFFLLPAFVSAQPPLTTVQDVVYRADGTRFQGSVAVRWGTFTTADRSIVPASEISVPVVNGVLRVRLVPTTNASPRVQYTVRYNGDGRTQATEYWSVPQSASALKVADVRTTTTAGDDTLVSIDTQIQLADVTGLNDALAVRPVRATDYVANHVLMVNPAGELQSILGADEDCIRVDGSTGACGSASASGPQFVDGETPQGAVDGFNSSYSLGGSPFPTGSLQLFRNGLLQKSEMDYNLVNSSIVFNSGSVPQTGDVLVASYRSVPSGPTDLPGFVDGEVPSGAVNGVNSTFLLTASPAPASSLNI